MDSLDDSMPRASEEIESTSTMSHSTFSAAEKGKGKDNNPKPECKAQLYLDESAYEQDDFTSHSEHNVDATWDSAGVARLKAIARSKLEPISFPAIADVFSSENEMRLIIASHALQQNNSATVRRDSRDKTMNMVCSISNTRSIRGDKNSCPWICRGNSLGDGTVQVYATHSKHDHAIGEKLEIQVRALNNSKGQGAKHGSRFPAQAIIIANAHQLIKNSTRPIVQDMTLSFPTAEEMRTYITGFAIINSFAACITLASSRIETNFWMNCYLGRGTSLVCQTPCTYRFRSNLNENKRWIVSDSQLDHNHEMGLFEMVGDRTQVTAKGMELRLKLQNSRSEESIEPEEAIEEDYTESEEEIVTRIGSTSKSRTKPEEQNRNFKRAKITRMDLSRSQSITSSSHEISRPQLSSTPATPTPPLIPAPTLRIESSPEWIASLTQLLTAIDPRLDNLATLVDNAGIQDERAVMEMMHLSDDGLEQLASKLVQSGGGMTLMQKMYFKKGIAKIRN